MHRDSRWLRVGRPSTFLLRVFIFIVGMLFVSPTPAAGSIRQLVSAKTANAHCTRSSDGMGGFIANCDPLPQSLTVNFPATISGSRLFVLAHWSTVDWGSGNGAGSMGACTDNLGQDWVFDNGQSVIISPPPGATVAGITSVTCETDFPTPPPAYAATSNGEWGVLALQFFEVTGVPLGGTITSEGYACSALPSPNQITILADYTPVTPNYSSNPVLGDVGVLGVSDTSLLTLEWPPNPDYNGTLVSTSIHATLGPNSTSTPLQFLNAIFCITVQVPQSAPGGDSGVNLGACDDECEKVAGSPINLTNGNVYIQQTDYVLPGLGGGIMLERTWNSLWATSSHGSIPTARMFGHSWTSNFEERLLFPDSNTVDYWRGDGSKWRFTKLLQVASLTIYGLTAPGIDVQNTGLSFDSNTSKYSLAIAHRVARNFDTEGYPTTVADSNGNVTTFTYDGQRHLTQITDAAFRTLNFAYGDPANPNQVTAIQDSVGVIATYQYDGSSRLTQVTFADGSFNRFNYDANSLVLSVTDTDAKILEAHTYDVYRRGLTSERANGVEKLTVSYSGSIASLVDSQGRVSQYPSTTINGRNYVTGVTGPGCVTCGGRGNQTFVYDAGGRRTSSTDASGNTTQFTYGSYGNVTKRSMILGGTEVAWNFTYNEFDEVLTARDPLGNTTTNTYDTKGNLLTTTAPSLGGNSPPSTTTMTYDSKGQLLTVTDPLNRITRFTYTAAGLIETMTDAQNKVTRLEYDPRGNRTALIDALNQRTTFTYDVRNRLTSTVYPTTPVTSSTFTYDTRGRRTSATDAAGKTTTYTYDDADRVITATDASIPAGVTQYEYDTENNLINVFDALTRRTHYDYDENGRVTQALFPSDLAEHYVYDAIGNLTSKTDRKNQTTIYRYDVLRRLTQKEYPNGAQINYTYDLASRLTQVGDPTGTYQFTYDNRSRMTQTSTVYAFIVGKTFTVGYEYDAAANLITMTDPQGGDTTYTYDTLNRLATLKNPQRNQFGFVYDALNRRTQLTRPNSVNTNYQYDSLSRVTSLLHQFTTKQGATTTLDGAQYTYGAAGNSLSKTDKRTNVVSNYAYDPLYQLTGVTQGANTVESYAFDAVGNRSSSLNVAYYTHNPSNQLTNQPGVTYTYDNNGNLDTKTDASGTTTYIWDYEDQLTRVMLPGGSQVNFLYDPMGRRIQKASGSAVVNYVYDGSNILQEVNAAGTLVTRYTHDLGLDKPLAMLKSGTTSYYLTDGIGSVTSLSNSSGSLSATYTYDSFGKLIASSGTSSNPYGFTGRELDGETGLYYYRARYYSPQTGRFINEDPLRFKGGVNFFAYVANNPTNLRDPLGLCPVAESDHCSMPPLPSGIPSDQIRKNVKEADDYFKRMVLFNPRGSFSSLLGFLTGKFVPTGDWDYKSKYDASKDPVNQAKARVFGNFNFGAVLQSLGFDYYETQNAAGIAQIGIRAIGGAAGTGFPLFKYPFGDQVGDAQDIKRGFMYWRDCPH